jgi:hypothetical protein
LMLPNHLYCHSLIFMYIWSCLNNLLSGKRTFFSSSCKVGLVAMDSFHFCLS